MKRRIVMLLMGLTLSVGIAVGSPGAARADSCSELSWAAWYHTVEGNFAYVRQLMQWYSEAGCNPDFAPIN
jgi:hypothetical protein